MNPDMFTTVKAILDQTAKKIEDDQKQRWETINLLKASLKTVADLTPKEDDHCGRLAVKIAEDALRETGDWPHA